MEGFNLLYFCTSGTFIGLVLGCQLCYSISLPHSLRGMHDDLFLAVLLLMLFICPCLPSVGLGFYIQGSHFMQTKTKVRFVALLHLLAPSITFACLFDYG